MRLSWERNWMNGSVLGYMWFCVENRIIGGEQFVALDFYNSYFPRLYSLLLCLISVVVVSYLRILWVYIFSLLLNSEVGVVP